MDTQVGFLLPEARSKVKTYGLMGWEQLEMDGKLGVVKVEIRWGQRDQGQPENQE